MGGRFTIEAQGLYLTSPGTSTVALTGDRYDASHPGISTANWQHNYGASGAHQYDRLAEAIALDRGAALESTSWGMFQVLGAMTTSEFMHLTLFGRFCEHGNLLRFLAAKNWTAFARAYNGPGQVDRYAADLERAYRHATGASPIPLKRLPG